MSTGRGAERNAEKKGFRRYLTPGWILTIIFVLLFTYFAFSFLAPWQLGKNERRSEYNSRLQSALEQDTVPVTDAIAHGDEALDDDAEWTHVSLQGHFVPDDEVLLRNRPVDSAVVFQVLTPFDVADGPTVLVNRGYIPVPAPGEDIDVPQPPTDETEVSGYIQLNEAPADSGVNSHDGHAQISSINTGQIAEAVDVDMAHDYVQLDDASATPEVTPIPLPQLESGPYLSYGIQWIAFGILAPVGLGWFIYAEIRERRREKQEQAEISSTAAADTASAMHHEATEVSAPAAPSAGTSATASDKLEERYGSRYGKKKRGFGQPKSRGGERF